jgi:two-component system, sensor histidine kinase and response regulator
VTNRQILRELLANWGMAPTAVESAHAALVMMEEALADGQPYHLVLLDLHMPEVDGFALAWRSREIRDSPARQS